MFKVHSPVHENFREVHSVIEKDCRESYTLNYRRIVEYDMTRGCRSYIVATSLHTERINKNQ